MVDEHGNLDRRKQRAFEESLMKQRAPTAAKGKGTTAKKPETDYKTFEESQVCLSLRTFGNCQSIGWRVMRSDRF